MQSENDVDGSNYRTKRCFLGKQLKPRALGRIGMNSLLNQLLHFIGNHYQWIFGSILLPIILFLLSRHSTKRWERRSSKRLSGKIRIEFENRPIATLSIGLLAIVYGVPKAIDLVSNVLSRNEQISNRHMPANQLITSDNDVVFSTIQEFITKSPKGILSIDGRTGSGKSYLATLISETLGIPHIELDDDRYLKLNQGEFVDAIKYHQVRIDVAKGLRDYGFVIVDGICTLKVLDNAGIVSSYRIYVKSVHANGYWQHQDDFNYSRSVEEVISNHNRSMDMMAELTERLDGEKVQVGNDKEGIYIETIRYHHDFHPDLRAELVYEHNMDST